MADEKKGITVKIDAALHAEIRQFIEANGMTITRSKFLLRVCPFYL